MKPKNISWVFFFSLIFSQLAISQQIEIVPPDEGTLFTNYSTDKGLSQSSVSAMLTDDEGYIWVGTQDGLNRFDGYEFQVFRSSESDSIGLSSSYITDLLLDEKGNLWIGTLDGGLNYLNKKTGVFTNFKLGPEETKQIESNHINELEIDREGNLWVGTLAGLLKFSLSENKYIDIKGPVADDLRNNKIIGLLVDGKNQLWASTLDALYLYKINEDGLEKIDNIKLDFFNKAGTETDSPSNWENPPGFIAEDLDSNLLFLNAKSLIKYSPSHNEFTSINIKLEKENNFTSLFMDQKGDYWITSLKKLFHLQVTKNGYRQLSFVEEQGNPYSIKAGSKINVATEDKSGNLWVGSWVGGLNRISISKQKFKDIRTNAIINNIVSDLTVTGLHVDANSTVWLGTWGEGLYKLSPKQNKSKVFRHKSSDPNSISSSVITNINEGVKNNLWISTYTGGLNELNLETEKFQDFWTNKDDLNNLNSKSLLFSFDDSNHNLWVSTYQSGLYNLDFENEILKTYMIESSDSSSISDNRPRTVFEDSQKRMWVTTNGGGLNLLNKQNNSFRHFTHDPDDPYSIPSNIVNTIIETSNEEIWIGTYSGFAKLVDLATGKFQRYSTEDGLANSVICAIEEDDQDRLWLSTFSGISCFDMESEKILNYNDLDGISNQEFNTLTSAKDAKTGEIYFGGQTTCTYFQPKDFFTDTINSKIVISKMTVHNSGKGNANKNRNLFIDSRTGYTFSHLDKILSFEIAALSFLNVEQQEYQYQLSGFSEQWYELDESRNIVFTNLDPGSYTLFAKVSNSQGYWSNSQQLISFSISPPWYQTWWAYILLIALCSIMINAIYRFQLSKKIALRETNRLTELDDFKTRFYSNITHEFRTPLTVITGMADELEKRIDKEPQKKISLIKKNSLDLLSLVNQMLDLSKLKAGKTISNIQQNNILAFLKYLTEAYQSYAKLKNVGLQFYSELDEIYMDFDSKQMEQVFNNLLSNAVKFTLEYGNILVVVKKIITAAKPFIEIMVKDNGIGISKEQLPYIFDRFHQANPLHGNQGSGIGLALAKELVNSMNGEIRVESELNEGSTFILHLPISNVAPRSKTQFLKQIIKAPAIEAEESSGLVNSELPILLIIEDNQDVAYYLKTSLSHNYQLIFAQNGKAGIEKATETLPDIIISDVMMPEMDGFEVCQKLKTSVLTNHIPIILLTAKATLNDKLEGFSHGADAYLVKPFEKEELIVRLDNLLQVRLTLQKKYSRELLSTQISKQIVTSDEEHFVIKTEEIILANLADETFSVHVLARELLLSRSQVHRKIKALTGMSTAIYIRHIRLQKAKVLLDSGDLTISEIAYQVGFNSLSYFSKSYKDTFGVSPSATRN